MKQLPSVTLIAMTGIGYKTDEHVLALKKSCEGIEFGAVKLIQIGSIKDIDTWNYAMIYELPKYVETEHCLVIHHDGYVINPELWDDEWLNLDYIGAPFPLPQDDYSYRDEVGELVRVGNSVSLRSKKLLNFIATTPQELFWSFKEMYGNTNEDGYITCHNRKWLEYEGCIFATLEQAIHFSKEHEIPENVGLSTFCFHTVD